MVGYAHVRTRIYPEAAGAYEEVYISKLCLAFRFREVAIVWGREQSPL
jgi:hypothetical protein